MKTNNVLLAGKHKWPESIDFDRSGNLYFSDYAEKALFRIKRNKDGALVSMDEKLLGGFEHVGGISVDKDNNLLYLGVRINDTGKIIQIPLTLFEFHTNIDYPSFNWTTLQEASLRCVELDIEIAGENPRSPKPNGVVFDKKTDSVFYTHASLKGFIGNIRKGNINYLVRQKLSTPNGIDIEPISKHTVVVTSLLLKNYIIRFNLTDMSETSSKKFGFILDGLLCLENGDVLVASFLSKKIFYLSLNGYTYENPCAIAKISSSPTDLALGKASDGFGESLFVTATSFWSKLPLIKCGKIIEVPNIRELINSKRNVK